MINQTPLPNIENGQSTPGAAPALRTGRKNAPAPHFHLTNHAIEQDTTYQQAEVFYLQKQIHSQTPMVIILSDGERLEGVIEWYDRHTLKVRGRERTLIYKSAIKYMYKLGENTQ